MSTTTTLLGLSKAADADNANSYIKTTLGATLDILDNAVLLTATQTLTNKTLGLVGDLTFTGTGRRILGDFSNATVLSKLLFQTSTVNGATQMGAIPNGTGTQSSLFLYNTIDTTNTGAMRMSMGATAAIIDSTGIGAVPAVDLIVRAGTGLSSITFGAVASTLTMVGLTTTISGTVYYFGATGATNPAFSVNASAGSSVTGLQVVSHALAGGADLVVSSSGTNEALTINAKGTGTITLAGVSTGAVLVGTKLTTVLSGTGAAGFTLPHGAAPTSPVNGDMWTTTAGLFVRINGVTKTVTLT